MSFYSNTVACNSYISANWPGPWILVGENVPPPSNRTQAWVRYSLRVALTLAKEDGYCVIAVKDSGIGMRPEQIETLLETFGNRENETASSYGQDLGLGLPLTQRLCRSMGGELIVESEAGRGSCFMIRVPLQPAMATLPANDHAELIAVNG